MFRFAPYLFLTTILSCTAQPGKVNPPAPLLEQPDQFHSYWSQGKAEITQFDLQQARYGEIHPGHAIQIFVTEDFLKDKQVKHETGKHADQAIPILKVNELRKFNTGIYDYATMTSTFHPFQEAASPHALKVSCSVQEWCGQVYSQFNRQKEALRITGHSYFEQEADMSKVIKGEGFLEDEIWTLLRLNPQQLPTGGVSIIPSALYGRLKHREPAVEKASASLGEKAWEHAKDSSNTLCYSLQYQTVKRQLDIYFEADFPYKIIGWEETIESGFGPNKRAMKTTAIAAHRTLQPYWQLNKAADKGLREQLGL